jgi:tellurite resistance protein
MTVTPKSFSSNEQIIAWLRGLLTIAWADGNFDANEQQIIADIVKTELAPCINWLSFDVISPAELAQILGKGTPLAENFIRTAIMVAIADGTYSGSEDQLLHQMCLALTIPENLIDALRHTLEDPHESEKSGRAIAFPDALKIVRNWLDGLEIHDPRVARFLCKMIPAQCPFARDVTLFGHKVVHIPPLCKINPLYEELVSLRFRALSYLADECGEDVAAYI